MENHQVAYKDQVVWIYHDMALAKKLKECKETWQQK